MSVFLPSVYLVCSLNIWFLEIPWDTVFWLHNLKNVSQCSGYKNAPCRPSVTGTKLTEDPSSCIGHLKWIAALLSRPVSELVGILRQTHPWETCISSVNFGSWSLMVCWTSLRLHGDQGYLHPTFCPMSWIDCIMIWPFSLSSLPPFLFSFTEAFSL